MKKIIFTNHALERLERLSFWKNPLKNKAPAERLLRRAECSYVSARGVSYYHRGIYTFVVKETESEMKVITILKN